MTGKILSWLKAAIWQDMPWAIDLGRFTGRARHYDAIRYDGTKISVRRTFRSFASARRFIAKVDRRRRAMRAQRKARRITRQHA